MLVSDLNRRSQRKRRNRTVNAVEISSTAVRIAQTRQTQATSKGFSSRNGASSRPQVLEFGNLLFLRVIARRATEKDGWRKEKWMVREDEAERWDSP